MNAALNAESPLLQINSDQLRLTLLPGGPGGPASPDGPGGPYTKATEQEIAEVVFKLRM